MIQYGASFPEECPEISVISGHSAGNYALYTVADMSGHIMFPYVAYKEIFRKLNFSQCSVPHCGCKVAEKYRVVAAPTIYQVR